MSTPREIFNQALTHIKRDGLSNLISWLENDTDFFTAPASTLFHGNYEGGLLNHSVEVLTLALTNFNYVVKRKPELEYLREGVFISALFHDVCKCNFYFKAEKWLKNSENKWASYSGYEVKDSLPIGHGEKSLFLISKYMQLTDQELMAVRWHMGHAETGTQIDGLTKHSYSQAFSHPLVRIIHAADMLAVVMEPIVDHKANAK